jgi:hypothetical protein
MMTILQLVVCVVGLLIWILSSQAKVSEAGRIMFWTGLLAFLITGHVPVLH